MKTKIGTFKPSYETMLAQAIARNYGAKRPYRKYDTYTKKEIYYLSKKAKVK
jgi:hypothetical protein